MAEIQIRTTSQHIWASASHVLQYKNERNIPIQLRRSINRVAALLEMVDLEFERVLIEREKYITGVENEEEHSELNTDNLKYVLDELLPKENWDKSEDYDVLIDDLRKFDIDTIGKLKGIIFKYLKLALDNDREIVNKLRVNPADVHYVCDDKERLRNGVFYTHMGLIREMLGEKYGKDEVKKRLFGDSKSDN